jgi:hypothetical protein
MLPCRLRARLSTCRGFLGERRRYCRKKRDSQRPCATKEKPRSRSCGVLDKDPGDDLLSHARCTLPSARARFTSEFGMGSGGSTQLLSPGRGWRVADLIASKPDAMSCAHALVWLPQNEPEIGSPSANKLGRSESLVGMSTRRRCQGHLRLYGQATRIISTG